jgi:predicted acyltransferase
VPPRPPALGNPTRVQDLSPTLHQRIVSLDQFRGYAVLGMFVVNFVAGLRAVHPVLFHHNTYFSYADSIMPAFLVACGFSYRLTFRRRGERYGTGPTRAGYVRRSLLLILLSLVIYGCGGGFATWRQLLQDGGEFLARLLKANLWEVLAIIGATQLFVLPWIDKGPLTRVVVALACLGLHLGLSAAFNFDFVYGRQNWLDAWWGAAGTRAWDGGFFGVLSWSFCLLAGTVACDVTDRAGKPQRVAANLLLFGAALMLPGYGLSCLTRLYDLPALATADPIAASPVWPDWSSAEGREWNELLAEPPFVPPPPATERQENYWMMGKRVVSASFALFSSGFALATLALFVLACDVGGWSSGLLRTFGQNPLAAYLLHSLVLTTIRPLVPADAPLWYVLLGLSLFLAVTYALVRGLERQGIYLRL